MSTIIKPAADVSVAMILAASLLALAGLAVSASASSTALAAEPLVFTVPADDGYGIADCLQGGSACGAPIADSFCEAHGHLRSAAFGSTADVTGSTRAGGPATPVGAVLIRCID